MTVTSPTLALALLALLPSAADARSALQATRAAPAPGAGTDPDRRDVATYTYWLDASGVPHVADGAR